MTPIRHANDLTLRNDHLLGYDVPLIAGIVLADN